MPYLDARDRVERARPRPLIGCWTGEQIAADNAVTLRQQTHVFAPYGEAVAVATERKQFAKRDPGSSLRITAARKSADSRS